MHTHNPIPSAWWGNFLGLVSYLCLTWSAYTLEGSGCLAGKDWGKLCKFYSRRAVRPSLRNFSGFFGLWGFLSGYFWLCSLVFRLCQAELTQVIGELKSMICFLCKTNQELKKFSVVFVNLLLHSIRLPVIAKLPDGLQHLTLVNCGSIPCYSITCYF